MEERLKFYDTGDAPRKNVDVMSAVADSLRKIAAKSEKPAKKSKKSLSTEDVVEEEEVEGKKEKKDKKEKKRDRESIAPVEEEKEVVVEDSEGKKKKKKKVSYRYISERIFNSEKIIENNSLFSLLLHSDCPLTYFFLLFFFLCRNQ